MLIVVLLLLSACQAQIATKEPRIETPALPGDLISKTSETSDEKTQSSATGPMFPQLSPVDPGSPLCDQRDDNLFFTSCSEGRLIITQSTKRRRLDIFRNQDVAFESDSLSIEAEIISTPAAGQPLDHNQYGIYFIDQNGAYRALRISGQYFNFENWSLGDELQIEDRYNRVYSPYLKPFGQSNYLKLVCTEETCDLYINTELAGRIPEGSADGVSRVGLFAASDWDHAFGRVDFTGFQFKTISSGLPSTKTFSLVDDLKTDNGTFSGMGLSGAFSEYEADGFHFSPVVPFNFYSTKTGPSLADVSVEVSVKMEIKLGVSGSQFAGVVCRSSQEGMVAAVIRVDGTYTVFRDTPQKPLSVLAKKASNVIVPGLSTNHLRLDCQDSQLDFYINGTLMESLADTRFGVRFGRAGLYTKSGSSPDPDAIIFSNFSITELR